MTFSPSNRFRHAKFLRTFASPHVEYVPVEFVRQAAKHHVRQRSLDEVQKASTIGLFEIIINSRNLTKKSKQSIGRNPHTKRHVAMVDRPTIHGSSVKKQAIVVDNARG